MSNQEMDAGEHVVTLRRWTICPVCGNSGTHEGPHPLEKIPPKIEVIALQPDYNELERRYKALEQASLDVVTRFRYPDVDGRIEDKGTAIGALRRLLDSLRERR